MSSLVENDASRRPARGPCQRHQPLGQIGRAAAQREIPTLQREPVCLRIAASSTRRRRDLGPHFPARLRIGALSEQRSPQFLHHRLRDVVLDGEDVVDCTVIRFGPQVISIGRLDELHGDPNSVSGFPNAALEDGRHIQCSAYDCRGLVSSLELERRRPGRHPAAPNLRANAHERVGHSIRH